MAFELTDRIERHLAGDLIAWLTTVTPAGLLDKYAARIEQMGRTPQWYDDAYGVALCVTPQRAWTIPS